MKKIKIIPTLFYIWSLLALFIIGLSIEGWVSDDFMEGFCWGVVWVFVLYLIEHISESKIRI